MRTLNSQNKEERRGHRERKQKKTQENKYKDKKINNLSFLREKRIKLKVEFTFIQLFMLVKVYIYNY